MTDAYLTVIAGCCFAISAALSLLDVARAATRAARHRLDRAR